MRQKYFYNDKNVFSEINEPWKAYFLGWMYSDGNIEKNLYRCRINLQESDRHVLDFFSKKVYINPPNLLYKKSRFNDFPDGTKRECKPQFTFSISSKRIVSNLLTHGLYPRKSLNLKFPSTTTISGDNIRYFIRGYFEGDGSINSRKSSCSPRVSIYGTYEFLLGIQRFLSSVSIKSTINKAEKIFSLNINRYDSICKFYLEIYSGDMSFFLNRKYEKLKNVYESRLTSNGNNKSSGMIGICYKKKINRWIARASVNGIRYNIGCYENIESAVKARVIFLKKFKLLC